MSGRSLQLPGAVALDLLRHRAQVALDTWIDEWAVGQPPPALLTVTTAIDCAQWQGHVCHELRDVNGGFWVRADAGDRKKLARCILGPDPKFASPEALEEIVDLGAAARADELRAALFGEHARLPPTYTVTHLPSELFAFGSGSVQIVCDTFGLRALVDARVWRALVFS